MFICCLSLFQAAITKYHRLDGLETTEIYFSQFWRLQSLQIKVSTDSVSGEICPLFAIISHGERGKAALWGLFNYGTNPIYEGSPQWPNYPPKTPSPNMIILGIVSTYIFWWGHKHSVYSIHLHHSIFFLNPHLRIVFLCFLERKEGREIDAREKH